MPRKAKTPAKASNTIRNERKSGSSAMLNSTSIAADLAAFRKAGGKIEVLGNTWSMKKAS